MTISSLYVYQELILDLVKCILVWTLKLSCFFQVHISINLIERINVEFKQDLFKIQIAFNL